MLFFFDVETTGLPRRRNASYRDIDNWPRIVSISWALHEPDDALVEHRYAIVRPDGFSIPADSTRVHGITTAQARTHGRPLLEVLDELESDLEQYVPTLLVAHNVEYDRNVLLAEMLRARRRSALIHLPCFCTMQETVDLCRLPGYGGGYKWPTLDELHRRLFGETFENAHDAAADVLACARCYFELKRREAGHQDAAATGDYGDGAEDESDEAQDLIDRILAWAEDHPSFDTSFVESVQEKLEEYGSLTERQLAALENIVDRFHID